MKRLLRPLLAALLCLALALGAAPVSAEKEIELVSTTGFTDVPRGAWYEEPLLKMMSYTPGIINGFGDGTFRPDNPVKRGEFLKMLMTAAQGYTIDHSRDSVHWAGKFYTIAAEHDVLVIDPFTSNRLLFQCNAAALEQEISRYEMAVLLSNVCSNMQMETTAVTGQAYSHITDYDRLDPQYLTAVEQAFGKGLLTGYEDGSFRGANTLKRCEAAVVIYRLLWAGDRQVPSWATEISIDPVTQSTRPAGFVSFAEWLQDGHIVWVPGYGDAPDAEARRLLFGDEDMLYFETKEQAAPYMQSVKVPIWTIDSNGRKISTYAWITVHKLVAEEVRLIFAQIYNDKSERFPFYGGGSVGGSRYNGETGRHAWGCAIDINPLQNCQCDFNTPRGAFRGTCGYGWWPTGVGVWQGRDVNVYHGSLSPEDSVYSISPGGSVVRAFAEYGWGWLGNGFHTNAEGHNCNFDFMHFSVLPNGG